ncbi:phosphatase PAP2 family protein [Silvimonas sp.]|uniref:phosphatase PAP2 family protein n=1 Tax=Silvimonas sp. TaxID=2650811 RepID=UPI00284ED5F5|nr:phosphatase PAP2 family protein [Silvimonas sp.]MDR3429415.1 phosphatase PAP2 family protein [Silvimonas sp.]
MIEQLLSPDMLNIGHPCLAAQQNKKAGRQCRLFYFSRLTKDWHRHVPHSLATHITPSLIFSQCFLAFCEVASQHEAAATFIASRCQSVNPFKVAMHFWQVLTNFGDSALLLPVAVVLIGWMLYEQAWRCASIWVALFVPAMVLVVATKLAFLGWGIGIERLDFTGFSGHTTLSMAIYPALAVWIVQRMHPRHHLRAYVLGWLFALVIGVSRLTLNKHSLSEVVAGVALGTAVSLTWTWLSALDSRPSHHFVLAVGILAMLIGGLHGERAPTQGFIARWAISMSHRPVPYNRYTAWPGSHPHHFSPSNPAYDRFPGKTPQTE